MKNNKYRKIANFLYEIGSLRKVIRSHRQTLLTDDLSDNISSHSFRVAWIGWILAKEARADLYKVLLMCLSHDITEARSGDQNWVNKKYLKVFEEEIIKEQLANLSDKKELDNVIKEYHERKTKEALIAKDADSLDQILLLKEYSWLGNREAKHWLREPSYKNNMQYKLLTTKIAKQLAREVYKLKPSDWWDNSWTEKRRK